MRVNLTKRFMVAILVISMAFRVLYYIAHHYPYNEQAGNNEDGNHKKYFKNVVEDNNDDADVAHYVSDTVSTIQSKDKSNDAKESKNTISILADQLGLNWSSSDDTSDNSDTTPTSVNHSSTNVPYLTMYGAHRAEKSFELLPEWLQDYIEWHGEQIRNSSNNTKYLLLSCRFWSHKCGGLSDRLRPLPFYLLYASFLSRVFCIYWEKPFGLENYLVPPFGSASRFLDWRCPTDVAEAKGTTDATKIYVECLDLEVEPFDVDCLEKHIGEVKLKKEKYVFARFKVNSVQRINRANTIFQYHTYEDAVPMISQWRHIDLMGDIFRVMFEPVPALTQRINNTMSRLGLKENEYVSVHVRSRYPVGAIQKESKERSIDMHGGMKFEGEIKRYLLPIIDNAINCGNSLKVNSTIYFASDNPEVVTDTIMRDIPTDTGVFVRPVSRTQDKEPKHFDGLRRVANVSEVRKSDYFSIFEDLLIMGGSSCAAYGMGSFGAFGAALSSNRYTVVHRRYDGKPVACPNHRTHWECKPSVKAYEGKLLFEFEAVERRKITPPSCDRASNESSLIN